MRVELAWGRELFGLEVDDRRVVAVHRQPVAANLADPGAALAEAVEHPLGYPALRRALIPDDHVAIAVDEQLPGLPTLLVPLLEHLEGAGITPQAITLLCQPPTTEQPWLEDLPDKFQEMRVEVHDPTDRKRLSYLATTRRGRRIYLNRTAVDADQLVLLTRRGYDTMTGYAGGECALFPGLSDQSTRLEAASKLSFEPPGKQPWPWQQEAAEVAWYLGAPFLVQVIEGQDAEIAGILAGPVETSGDGQKLLDDRWHVEVDQPADVVVAGVGGNPARHTFLDLARALACAARVVKPQGRIVLLSQAEPSLGRSAEIMRLTEDPGKTLLVLAEEKPIDHEAGFLWAHAAQVAKLYLLSRLPEEVTEEMFVVPLDKPSQVERILGGQGSCLFLPDAHKTMAVVK